MASTCGGARSRGCRPTSGPSSRPPAPLRGLRPVDDRPSELLPRRRGARRHHVVVAVPARASGHLHAGGAARKGTVLLLRSHAPLGAATSNARRVSRVVSGCRAAAPDRRRIHELPRVAGKPAAHRGTVSRREDSDHPAEPGRPRLLAVPPALLLGARNRDAVRKGTRAGREALPRRRLPAQMGAAVAGVLLLPLGVLRRTDS